jgi:threonine dehydratase
MTGAQLFFKCENCQRMGAFKFRGAYNALARFTRAARAGVLTFSSGNHAQAIALSARLLGIRPPSSCRRTRRPLKVAATRATAAK